MTEAYQVRLGSQVLLALKVAEKVKKVSKENQAKEGNLARMETLGRLV